MDREGFSIKDLTIDELAAQAMQLLTFTLIELYAVLGLQLVAYSQPARLAGVISHHTTLRKTLDGELQSGAPDSARPISELSRGLDMAYAELEQEGLRFVTAVKEELCKLLCTQETLELADRTTASSMQVLILLITGALRMSPQTESLAPTIAAIVCKSGLKDFCQIRPVHNSD
jgi:hypothetical protein